ncbi:M23 family metallopeptidase [Marinobacter bohaiensis]|uniref:M23 family metallopeptidase n=1 Tax=Marinobacter bohaiensis TaxID=2201898 RepID=UPI000DAC7622|nr:M23 family metallopeptidase [Marinobacter bohaiensis]
MQSGHEQRGRTRRRWCLLGLLWPFALSAQESDTLQTGRELTERFYAGQTDALWDRFNPAMREALGSRQQFAAFQQQVAGQLGDEQAVLSENVAPAARYQVYLRQATFEQGPGPVVIQWTVTDADQVAGFFIQPAQAAPSPYTDYQTHARLRLPFRGDWFVYWGGRDVASNYHARARDQRYAYDFLRLEDGRSYRGEGTQNGDYYCFGEPILAPAPGTVLAVENELPDNAPGAMDPLRPLGNHVILDLGQGEYAFFAHFRQGSVAVETGDQVATGDTLGACGNSGNSSEPHLHFHLQDSPQPFGGDGLPAAFMDYRVDGETVERGEPVRGERIRPLAK